VETLFEKLLLTKLAELWSSRAAFLTDGHASNIEEYKYNAGYLKALNDIEASCDEIREEMNK
jgi:hypothetical protein